MRKLALLLVLGMWCSGCAMFFYLTHQPRQEVVLKGSARLESDVVVAELKQWTFEEDKKYNLKHTTYYSVDVYNKTNEDLHFRRYTIETKDGQSITVDANTMKPAVTYATGNYVFAPKSMTSLSLELVLSRFPPEGLLVMKLYFEEGLIILKP